MMPAVPRPLRERERRIVIRSLRRISSGRGWRHDGHMIYDPQAEADRVLRLLGETVR